jgi:hypothetical protein
MLRLINQCIGYLAVNSRQAKDRLPLAEVDSQWLLAPSNIVAG